MPRRSALGLTLLAAVSALAMEDLVLYECPRLPSPPVMDGKLDAAWNLATAASLPYKFLTDPPVPAGSRSEFRLAFDDEAMYLWAMFYKDSDQPLKRNHAGRDDPDLWLDDSAEIYFDPHSNGRFFKFVVSNAGVVTDFHQTDAGMDYGWDAKTATIATAVTDEGWSLEMAVPWADFGNKPAPGALWGFELLRFSGKNWASWTVGAAFSRPEKFGYVCFGAGGFLANLTDLVRTVRNAKGDHWRMVTSLGLLEFSAPGPALQEALTRAQAQVREARFEAGVVADDKKRAELLVKLDPLEAPLKEARAALTADVKPADVPSLLAKLNDAAAQARNIEYEARILSALAPR